MWLLLTGFFFYRHLYRITDAQSAIEETDLCLAAIFAMRPGIWYDGSTYWTMVRSEKSLYESKTG